MKGVNAMKCYVCDVQKVDYADKRTGEPRSFIRFGCVRNSMKSSIGKEVCEVLVFDSMKAVYSGLVRDFAQDDFAKLEGGFIEVDFDNRGQLCNFEVLPPDPDAVVWGF